MDTGESTAPKEPGASNEPSGTRANDPGQPLTTLRGASVEVDPRRVGRVVIGLCVVVLSVLVVVLFVAGFQRNARINRLREHGVATTITVSGCSGLLGGSGSNAAGYACRGTYSVGGHRYSEVLPGDSFHRSGSTVQGVTVPNDPGLVSTASVLAGEHTSWKVFILPSALLIVLALLVSVVVVKRRSATSGEGRGVPAR